MNIAEFIRRYNIRLLRAEYLGESSVEYEGLTGAARRGWQHDFTLTLVRYNPTRRFTVAWHQGEGIGADAPNLAHVLESLGSEAADTAAGTSFEEWAAEYGYDSDSRKAEATYRAVRRLGGRLLAFLGEQGFADLLDVEF